jgi:hypothetical protein
MVVGRDVSQISTRSSGDKGQTLEQKVAISLWALIPFLLVVVVMFGVGLHHRNADSERKTRKDGVLTKSLGGDIALIGGGTVLFSGLTLGMMFIPNLAGTKKST